MLKFCILLPKVKQAGNAKIQGNVAFRSAKERSATTIKRESD
jgi:hypothetical protein